MSFSGGRTIRQFDRQSDAAAVRQLDTSYTTDSMYAEVAGATGVFLARPLS
jgi:hypothetical protein